MGEKKKRKEGKKKGDKKVKSEKKVLKNSESIPIFLFDKGNL